MARKVDSIQSKGGRVRAQRLSAEQRSEIAKSAAAARWELPQAFYSGQLEIGDLTFPCSVLSDGTRILTQSDFMRGMGMYYSGWVSQNRSAEDAAAEVPQFLSFKSIKPFVDKHLGDLQSIIVKYRTERGKVAHGIRADIIPKICDVWLDAEEHERLGPRQKKVARNAKLLIRALAHVGIIALVDEATGYQYARARDALEKILERYISDRLLKWAKRFPDEFYKEMFRLKGWNYLDPIKARPMVVGKYTNDLVYERLAPGVLEEIQRLNPPNDRGRRRWKNHQWLSEDVGHPALRDHLMGVIALMKASPDNGWGQFKRTMNRVYPKCDETIEMALNS